MKQVLTNVYDNCEITDANVCVCGGGVVTDKRGRLHSLFPPITISPSQEAQSGSVLQFKGDHSDYYINSVKTSTAAQDFNSM